MKRKYKMTGCFRFFLFLLFFIPIAYFGAMYFNGENGLEKIKAFFGSSEENVEQVETVEAKDGDLARLEQILDQQDEKIKILERENRMQKITIEELEARVDFLRKEQNEQ